MTKLLRSSAVLASLAGTAISYPGNTGQTSNNGNNNVGSPENGVHYQSKDADRMLSPSYDEWMFQFPMPIIPVKQSFTSAVNPKNGAQMDYYEFEIKEFYQQIYPNKEKTRFVGYDGMYPGPTVVVERGHETVVRYLNNGDRDYSVHLHGAWSRAPWDGWAEDLTPVGYYKDHYYSATQNGRTQFYHDHAVGTTSENVYSGQSGFYILHDPADDQFNLPSGKYDVSLSIITRRYNHDGSLWSPLENGETDKVDGDVIHVNNQPWPYLEVEPRQYRFRILNVGISRDYVFSFVCDDGENEIEFTVVGADSGLLRYPVKTTTLGSAVAERYEIVLDFSDFKGQNITMKNAKNLPGVDDFTHTDKIMRFVVGDTVTDNTNNGPIPSKLRDIAEFPQSSTQRTFTFNKGVEWTINGVPWEDVRNRILADPSIGATETWTLINASPQSHPVHLHLVDLEVISRTGGRGGVQPYESAGQKDVVWLQPGEIVKLKAAFQPWDGLYMFHCHNLLHEDHAMMNAMNVSMLANIGNYIDPSTLVNPVDPRFKAVPASAGSMKVRSGDFSDDAIKAKMDYFASLNAYPVAQDQKALLAYWATAAAAKATGGLFPRATNAAAAVAAAPTDV